ncbi:MAG: CPXCG motif-containing cysteine-rich protein [Pseudomonadales bacterium]
MSHDGLEPFKVNCPYCGEIFETLVNYDDARDAGTTEYYEDCYVCCRPILFRCSMELSGSWTVQTLRDDD